MVNGYKHVTRAVPVESIVVVCFSVAVPSMDDMVFVSFIFFPWLFFPLAVWILSYR